MTRDVRNELLNRKVFGGFAPNAEVNSWVEVFVCFWKVTCALERGESPDWLKAWEAQKELVLWVGEFLLLTSYRGGTDSLLLGLCSEDSKMPGGRTYFYRCYIRPQITFEYLQSELITTSMPIRNPRNKTRRN